MKYNQIKSPQIKIKNTLCMQCGHQSCLMISSGVCPVFWGSKQEIINIKEDNHDKKNKETYIIGVDHGYGNMKTANCCFQTGVTVYEKNQFSKIACLFGITSIILSLQSIRSFQQIKCWTRIIIFLPVC